MTIPSTTRKAGPLLGTGSQTAWPFTFKVFSTSDVAVTIADSIGVETLLVLDTDYSVALNANQDTSPGGTVTYPISGTALPTGSVLTIAGDLDYDQPLAVPTGGNFNPAAFERQLDRMVMQVQQIKEQLGRTLRVGVTSDADATLPAPVASNVIGWDATASALENYPLSELATAIAFATYRYDTFAGDGVEDTFALAADPVSLGNIDVSVDGITFVPGVDHTLVGTSLVFTTPPANGVEILARYGQGLGSGMTGSASDISYTPAGGVATTVENTLRKSIFSSQYPTLQEAMTAAAGGILYIEGTNAITASLTPASNTTIEFLPSATITVAGGLFSTGDAIFKINEKDAVTIKGHGATITGTREGSGTSLIWMGVLIGGSTNIRVYDLNCVNMAGDGFLIQEAADNTPLYSENVWLERCRAYNCMRQGLSLVSCKNFWAVNCLFANTNGKSPEAGVDVEPSGGSTLIVNCNFVNCMATMNVGGGFLSVLGNNATPITTNPDLVFDNCVVYDSTTSGMVGFDIANHKSTMANDGRVLLRNCTARNTDSYGLVIRNIDKAGQGITVENFQALDTNTGQRTTYGGNAPVSIYATSSASWPNPGNIVIDGLKVVDNTADRTPYYINSGGTAFDNVVIRKLDWRNSVGETSFPFMDAATTNTYVEFSPQPYRLDRTSNITLTARYSNWLFSNKGAAGAVVFTLPAVAVGLRFTFEVHAAQVLRVTPNASDRLRPYASNDAKYMESSAIGNSATVAANQDGTDWVIQRFGTWTDEP